MSAPLEQQPDQLRPRAIALAGVGLALVVVTLVAIAWWLVVPPPAAEHLPSQPSVLEHRLFEHATGGDDDRAGAARLQRYEWIDRGARIVRIPIDRAIDAVVANPSLIGAATSPVADEAQR